jgi:hypothetical protein
MNGKKLLFKYLNSDSDLKGVHFHGYRVVLCACQVHDDGSHVHRVDPSFLVCHVRERGQRVLSC